MTTTSVLYDFSASTGYYPQSGLLMDSSGNLFGITEGGGANNGGTVFEIQKQTGGYAGTPVVIANLSSLGTFPGPQGPLISDAAGDLFGTTSTGGPNSQGGVFEIVKTASGYSSTPVMIARFTTDSAWLPSGPLVADAQGNLFGTTIGGGKIFEIAKTASGYSSTPIILASLDPSWTPSALIIDSAGNLIGLGGGGFQFAPGTGTNAATSAVFELAKTATGYASSVTALASLPGGYSVMAPPALVADAAGDLFGATPTGGIFEIAKTATGYSGTAQIIATITGYYFDSVSETLAIDSAGDIFGTSSSAGANNAGVIFEIVKTASGYDGTPVILQTFSSTLGGPGSRGVLLDGAGNLIGTASGGTVAISGSVYELANTASGYASTTSTLAVLGTTSPASGMIGSTPMSGLTLDRAGDLFGTTYSGGANGGGTVFEIAKGGSSISLGSVGGLVSSSVVVDAAGDVFGVSSGTGSLFNGSVFEIAKTANGYASTATVLTNFSNGAVTGYAATGGLTIDSSGNLFGSTAFGGTGGGGTVYEIAKTAFGYAGPVALVNFDNDLDAPLGDLRLDAAGNLFGRANGGANGLGTIFEVAKTASGYASTPTTLTSFSGFTGSGPLTLDSAGDIFGTGAILSSPTAAVLKTTTVIYELAKTASGYAASPTVLVTFDSTNLSIAGGLLVDSAGDLFGTSGSGGANGQGGVFEIVKTANGYDTTPKFLMSFNGTNGSVPTGSLAVDASGTLYGTTEQGGANGGGTVFKVTDSGYQFPTVSVSTAVTSPQSGPVSIVDSSSNVTGNLAALQKLAASSSVVITFSDPTPPTLSLSGSQLVSDANALAAIQSPYSLTVTGSSTVAGLSAVPVSDLAPGVLVTDSAANVTAALGILQNDATAGKLGSITLTDAGIPTLSLTTSQLASDAAAIKDISGMFTLSEAAPSSSATIAGASNALGNTLVFSGDASQYTITPSGDGVHFTVTGSGATDTLSNIQALQFGDHTLIVAQTPGTAGAVTTGNVAELYAAVFGRQPDVPGLSYYQQELAANSSLPLQTLAQNFLTSPEYTGNAAHSYAQSAAGDAQFIIDSYSNLLHRAPETGAVAYYQGLINQFTQNLTPGTAAYAQAQLQGHAVVVTDFSQSGEFLGDVQVTAKAPASAQHWLLLI